MAKSAEISMTAWPKCFNDGRMGQGQLCLKSVPLSLYLYLPHSEVDEDIRKIQQALQQE